MELTKDEAVRLHRELWDWLSKNPDKSKRKWPGWEWNGGENKEVWADCFACEITGTIADKDGGVSRNCAKCFLVWPSKMGCDDEESLFDQWNWCDDDKEKVALAEQIRDLPVRESEAEA